jgi:SAM-dependent methyltransferase
MFAALYDRITAHSENAGFAAKRRELLFPLQGDVVEIGAGTGANLEHYGDLNSLLCIEPDQAMRKRLEKRAETLNLKFDVKVVDTTFGDEVTPLMAGSVDAVVSTLVLCSVSNLVGALHEIRRVLRPGGSLVVIEHVRSIGPARLIQTTLTPLQRMIAGGCRLNRDTKSAIVDAGFDVSEIVEWEIPGSVPLLRGAIAGRAR